MDHLLMIHSQYILTFQVSNASLKHTMARKSYLFQTFVIQTVLHTSEIFYNKIQMVSKLQKDSIPLHSIGLKCFSQIVDWKMHCNLSAEMKCIVLWGKATLGHESLQEVPYFHCIDSNVTEH